MKFLAKIFVLAAVATLTISLCPVSEAKPGPKFRKAEPDKALAEKDEELIRKKGIAQNRQNEINRRKQIEETVKDVKFDGVAFKECKAVGVLDNAAYKKNQVFWDKAIYECGVDVQVLPATGWISSFLGKMGGIADEQDSAYFLEGVAKKAKEYVEINNKATEYLIACAENDVSWFSIATRKAGKLINAANCEKDLASIRKRMKDKRGEQREITALTRYGATVDSSLAEFQNTDYLNVKLYGTGGVITPDWNALYPEEAKKAEKRFAADTKKIEERFEAAIKERQAHAEEMKREKMPQTEIDRIFPELKEKNKRKTTFYRKFRLQERQKIQAEYRDKYFEHVSDLPIMLYVGSDNPSDAELAAGLKKVLANGKEELAKLEELTSEKADFSDLTAAMKYGPVVKEILKKDPKLCGIATGIANHIEQKEGTRMGATLIGTVGFAGLAAIRGPAVLGMAATAANSAKLGAMAAAIPSGYLTASDWIAASAAESRALSVADTMDGAGHAIGDMTDVVSASDTAKLALAMSPLDLWGMGLAKASMAALKVGGAAAGGALTGASIAAGKKYLERAAVRKSLSEGLQAKGVSKAESDRLINDLKSKDNVVASRAGAEIVKKLNLDPEEIAMVRLAAQKSLLSADKDDPLKYINLMLKDLPADVKERKLAVRKALEILENTNHAKLNEANRGDVVKAVVAAANFGHTDPKHIAKVVTDWDQGLDSLAETFKQAKLKLNSRELASMPSQTARKEAAFEKALEEQMEKSEHFRNMNKADREAAKKQMTACANGKAS